MGYLSVVGLLLGFYGRQVTLAAPGDRTPFMKIFLSLFMSTYLVYLLEQEGQPHAT